MTNGKLILMREFVIFKNRYTPIIKRLLREYGPCKQCGHCCRTERVTISMEDSQKLKEDDPEFFDNSVFKIFDENIKLVSLKLPCPYLNGNRCRSYNVRPSVCSLYPFIFAYGSIAIVHCPFGERVINDIVRFCKMKDIDVSNQDEDSEQKMIAHEIDKIYDKMGIKTEGLSSTILHVPSEVFDEFIMWKKKKR